MNVALTTTTTSVRMSVQEFLDWAETADGRWELVDGEPREMTPPLRSHGALCAEVVRMLGNHLEHHRPTCSAIIDPGIVPPLVSAQNMLMPDVAVTCSPYDTEERALADPVVIVEILSPSNQARTRSNVRAYTTIPSVQEILVLHGDAIHAERLRRGTDGSWPTEPEETMDGDLTLASIDFRVGLAALYRTTRLARR